MPRARSVVLITVDCLRADHVGFLGYPRHTTPFLDELARESTIFSNAIVAGTPTYYSFPAIMTSRYPLALGRHILGLSPDEPTLASNFSRLGYATGAFLAGNPYLSRGFGYHAGFDTFVDFLPESPDPLFQGAVPGVAGNRLNRKLEAFCRRFRGTRAVYDEVYFQYCQRWIGASTKSLDTLRCFPSADLVVDRAAEWLATLNGNSFFLWLHLMDPHSPYYPKEQSLGSMGYEEMSANRAQYLNSFWNRCDVGARRLRKRRDEVVSLYDAGVRWVDAQVECLASVLRRHRLWDDCVLAFTADHGEEFLEHGGRYHSPSKLTDELIRVPLLLRGPVRNTAEMVEEPFSLLDIAPTLLDAAEVPGCETFRGQSRWNRRQNRAHGGNDAIVECIKGCSNPLRPEDRLGPRILAVRETRFKLVFDFGNGIEQLFDLHADPQELRPLALSLEIPVRRRLLERVRWHTEMSWQSRDSDACLKAHLRELQGTAVMQSGHEAAA